MKTWIVLLQSNVGAKVIMYVVHADSEDIARDKCVRALVAEHPSASVLVLTAYETELYEPVKLSLE